MKEVEEYDKKFKKKRGGLMKKSKKIEWKYKEKQ